MNRLEIKVFIVNLKFASGRKRAMELEIEKAKQWGFKGSFEFFDAVDVQQTPEFDVHQNNFLAKVYNGRVLSSGEKGCFASHFILWKKCVELNRAIVVLEDDVELLDGFNEGLQEIANSDYEYVRLMGLLESKFKKLCPGFSVAYKSVSGTQGYYITPSAARKFIAKARCWVVPVDKYMDRSYVHGVLNILHLPYLIQEHSNSKESTITDRPPLDMRKLGIGIMVLYKLNRLHQKIQKHLFAYRKRLR